MTRPPLAAPIASLLIASFLLPPNIVQGQEIAGETVDAAATRTLVRLQQRERLGREETAKGDEALSKKDYEDAFAHYKNACEAIIIAPATSSSRRAAVNGLTTAGRKLAEQRVTEGYYASAVQALQVVLTHNPDDSGTLKLLANIEAPDYFNKQMTPQHREKIEKVKELFISANGHKQLGRYDLALQKYEEILNLDPNNSAARQGREEVYILKTRPTIDAYNATRSQAMFEVSKEWERPYRRFDRKAVVHKDDTKSTAPSTVAITRKLNGIVLPRVDFKESTVREAIEFLVKKSKDLDPEAVGVNIVLKLDEQGGAVAPPPAAPAAGLGIPGLDAPAAAPGASPAPVMTGGAGTRVTLTLNNVPLIEVIKYITNLANLKYKIEPFAVSIVPLGTNTDEMFIKEWKVSPIMFREAMGGGGAGGLAAGAPAAPADPNASSLAGNSSAKDFLAQRGVTFGPNAFAMYSPASSTLIVKNTSDQLDVVERIVEIQANDTAIKQIEIQAKFVEITQNNLKELSFDWLLGQANLPGSKNYPLFFGGGTSGTSPATNPADFTFVNGTQPIGTYPVTGGNRSGNIGISASAIDALLFGSAGASRLAPGIASIAGVGTDPVFQMVLRGLDQKKGVDLLSSPRVTTKSGNRAVIEIIREFRYATEFQAPQIPQNFGGNQGGINLLPGGGAFGGGNNGNFPVTPTTPTAFETRNVGVTLEVEPVIGPDGYTIDMQLAPQVTEFEGFINYGSPIQSQSTNPITGQTTTNVITPNIINQPIFSTRKVTTNVSVYDGATVVLGGLVREDVQKVEDKTPIIGDIPLIGRLFRSNIDSHIKRNLVIFVTAHIVNAEGQPLQNDEEKEEKVDELPLPDITPGALPDISAFTGSTQGLKK
ncbi:MAG: Amuc_1098 family type IV pilus outer membrane protein [Verrucomicrobiota bacterium]